MYIFSLNDPLKDVPNLMFHPVSPKGIGAPDNWPTFKQQHWRHRKVPCLLLFLNYHWFQSSWSSQRCSSYQFVQTDSDINVYWFHISQCSQVNVYWFSSTGLTASIVVTALKSWTINLFKYSSVGCLFDNTSIWTSQLINYSMK